jgi:hypothetical protein
MRAWPKLPREGSAFPNRASLPPSRGFDSRQGHHFYLSDPQGMGSTFIPGRCAHIDTVGSNVLIRGNMPLIAPDMHYALEEIEAASKVSLRNRDVIDVPIIDNVGERAQWTAILDAFGVDPNLFPTSFWPLYLQPGWQPNALLGSFLMTEGQTISGSILWRPFEGLPAGEDPKVYLGWPGWDFSGFIDHVVDLLHTLQNTAIYVHCQLGADRTGAFHIGYLMKTQNLNLKDATNLAVVSTSAGLPNADYMRLVAAYAKAMPV